MENDQILFVSGIIILAFVAFIGAYYFETYADERLISEDSSSSNFTSTSTTTSLTPVEEGITSLTAQTYNQTWLEFDGVNDLVEIDIFGNLINSNTLNTNWTITGWFNTSSEIMAGENIALFGCNNGEEYANFYVGYNFENGYTFVYGDNDRIHFSELNDGQWTFVALTMEANNNLTFYINDSNEVEFELNFSLYYTDDATQPFYIGKQQNPFYSGNYVGSVDEFRIYNRTLSSDELNGIYNSGRQANSSLPSDDLQLWYSFNENNGIIVYDKSGNSNNGI